MEQVRIRQALISVSDKSDLIGFARGLTGLGIAILATGGTYRSLKEAGVPVTEVADYTGFPEMMGGRLKTLHPKIHGGILGRRDRTAGAGDAEVMAAQGIPAIDLVVVNLYPFEAVVGDPACDFDTAIENIDIGGPAMVRSAAKNHASVTTIVDVADYGEVLEELEGNGGAIGYETRFRLAVKAFARIAAYDGAIANFLGSVTPGRPGRVQFPQTYSLHFEKVGDMRYGENPHQRAAFYRDVGSGAGTVTGAVQKQGKELSFNNVADADTALECARAFARPACVIVKHANPCGAAVADDIHGAYLLAHATDPESTYGGIVAFNRGLDERTAAAIVEHQFAEVVIAPTVDAAALRVFAGRKNLRVLACGEFPAATAPTFDLKRVNGGLLVQERDLASINAADLKVVSRRQPTAREIEDLLFAWTLAQFVKSNAIVYAREGRTIGIGAGQMSRVFSARIAALKAREQGADLAGAVMASDAFFPFRDGVDAAVEAGIRAVIQPGGSVRDEEVIAAADAADLAMVFTGVRHFRH